MKKYLVILLLFYSAIISFGQNKGSTKTYTYEGYFESIDVGDRGTWLNFKDAKGKERSFRENPYNSIGYFLITHKNQLVTVIYGVRKIIVPNASDGYKLKETIQEEDFLSASIGKLTNSIWWEGIKAKALKSSKGNRAKVLQKLKKQYDDLVDKSTTFH